jgi:hypothetical protein
MHLSIWQQWASNHSSEFSLVGEFATADEARRAGQEIERIIERLHQLADEFISGGEFWLHQEEAERLRNVLGLPAEMQFQYFPEWVVPADTGFTNVTVIDRHLFLSDRGRSGDGNGYEPFDQIITHWGGQLAGGTVILVTLSCIAPDEATATRLHAQTTSYLRTVTRGRKLCGTEVQPWLVYRDGIRDPREADLIEAARNYIAWMTGYHQYKGSGSALEAADQAIPPHPLQAVIRHFWVDTELACFWMWSRDMRIEQEMTRLTFVDFLFHNTGRGLQALMAWLKDNGCTDLVYSYREPA